MVEVFAIQDMGQVIKRMRKAAKLSQSRLAELSELSRTAIQSLESGKETCQLDTLFKVLKILNIRISFHHPLLKDTAND